MAEKSKREAEQSGTPADGQSEGKIPAESDGGERTRERPVFRPRVDILENDKGLVLTADLPGVDPDNLEVELEKRVLTIRGRVDEEVPEGFGVLYKEYEIGDFERRFTLSGDFDPENVEADLENGVLRLTIPTAPEREAKRIDVKSR